MGIITKCLTHKNILLCRWVCIAIYSLHHFSATLPWSSCGRVGQELVQLQFHIMHMSNDLENKQEHVRQQQVSGNIQCTLIHVCPCRRQYQPCSQALSSSCPSLAPRCEKKRDPGNEVGVSTSKQNFHNYSWCLLKVTILAIKLNTNVLQSTRTRIRWHHL